MSRKKLMKLLAIPIVVAAIGSGVAFASYQVNAEASQSSNQTGVDKPEPGDKPDKPGEADSQSQQDKNGQQDIETND